MVADPAAMMPVLAAVTRRSARRSVRAMKMAARGTKRVG